jgi:hypothetical protein
VTDCAWWVVVLLGLNVMCLGIWILALPLRAWQMVRLEQAVREFRRQTRTITKTYLPGAEVLKHLDDSNGKE